MWLGILIYNDGMSPTFRKAKTKKEIVEWLENYGFDEGLEDAVNQGDGISYQVTSIDFHVAYIVNLNAKKINS